MAASGFTDLLAEYGVECGNPGIGIPQAQMDAYVAMERAQMIHVVGAFVDGALAGFAVLLMASLPHYGQMMAATESLFVSPRYRKSGVGNRLREYIEGLAAHIGAVGISISAPQGGRLERILPRVGYAHTNTVFYKRLK